jgi:hypothetical protein
MLNSSQKELTCNMQSSQVHALMMASNVLVERSATRARQVSLTPARPNKDPRCHAQPATISLSPDEAALIYFHNFAKIPPPLHHPIKTVGKNSKRNLTLPCGKNATKQG